MITRCPTCNEWLTPTDSGAVCAAGHGGIYATTDKDIKAAKRMERYETVRLAFEALPMSHNIDIGEIPSGLYSIEGTAGIYRRVKKVSHHVLVSSNGKLFARYKTWNNASAIWELRRDIGLEHRLCQVMGIESIHSQ